MNRRHFLKVFGAGALALAGRGVASAFGANHSGQQGHAGPPPKTRPPGTCGGYTDPNADGICERSINGPKPCGAIRCPANVKNVDRTASTPAGSCALWKDPQKKGFCAVCLDPKPCLYTLCPTHKDYKPPQGKGTVM
jgi:hypothetical protein